MTPLEIWIECRRSGITLTVDGDRFTWRGPQDAANRLLPAMRANRFALRECARELNGLPIEDGPFLPWGPYMTPELVKQWQRELYDAVTELARLERWPDEFYDHVVLCIERQPLSTLRPDLTHFTERLAVARASIKAENRNEQH
ncbi:hypothetical protein WJ96_33195 [Burkholderia ubonensis]|uniref:TubC N-terminal docking domain-containing protein n=1 Tax=Burkholderia ubonensis TaxID=101571 RepID=A0AAW3N095_9BURK|nr:hypothetical protein [Burkholderia ubonensis]KVN81096.1 hypothetical protein WJ67_06525 [Burkholderia ubonensis]KVQ01851.1 hypothetical protein WJ96_33195 [Burkholderia ubonensis]KVZ88259.1 hypothetical protein WL25_26450 [Burkholderia ubonensis]